MCSADLVEITIHNGEVAVIGSDIVSIRNKLSLLAEREEAEMLSVEDAINIATQAQEAQTKLELIKQIFEVYSYSEDRLKGIAAIVGYKEEKE